MRKESWGQFTLPVSGVQIEERGRKIHEEKKNLGRLEGPPPRFPGVQFNSLPYYLNTWNRLIVIGPGKLLPFTFKIAVSFSSFADNMMRL